MSETPAVENHKMPPYVIRFGSFDRFGLSSWFCLMITAQMLCMQLDSDRAENRRWALKGLKEFGQLMRKHGGDNGVPAQILNEAREVYFLPKEPLYIGCDDEKGT